MREAHIPVLLKEVIYYLDPKPNENFIDLTLGAGGHAEEILKKISPKGILIGIDLDKKAIEIAKKRLEKYKKRVFLFHENYKNITKIKNECFKVCRINGILLDLGLSSITLRDQSRGFSFTLDGPLDMRFDPWSNKLTAADILNTYSLKNLEKIFKEYGEDKFYKSLAAKVIQCRSKQKFKNTSELVFAVLQVYKDKLKSKSKVPYLKSGLHPATRVFQALRIAVNQELDNLKEVLPEALKILTPQGRLTVISFHSLEDRIVKNFFRQEAKDCLCPSEIPICQCHHKKQLKILTKKPVRPKEEEIKKNPRSRSARLRIAQKI